MYTQCPDCRVAFRVTAAVLKKAAGKVRCGGCGSPFNALEYLSEEKPAPRSRPAADQDLPELRPDLDEASESRSPPVAIAAEQSAALLKTLDQLAGEDIRIEDTGIEWRVLGADEEPDDADEGDDTPIVAESAVPPAREEFRYDDNTPLPDDFDFHSEPIAPPAPDAGPVEHSSGDYDAQVDLTFGDTVDWEEILDEVGPTGMVKAAAETRDAGQDLETQDAGQDLETQTYETESGFAVLEADDPNAEDIPDVDTQFGLQALAMGIDLSSPHAVPDDDESGTAGRGGDSDEMPAPIVLEATSIDDDLLTAVFEAEAAGARVDEELVLEEAPGEEAEARDDEELTDEFPVDIGDDESACYELADDLPVDEAPTRIEMELEEREQALREQLEKAGYDAGDDSRDDSRDDAGDGVAAPADEYVVPELSEEERSINMLIDQDLLAAAVEDEDGSISTIAQLPAESPDERTESDLYVSGPGIATESVPMETIIMEGEFVRNVLDDAAEENRAAAAASLAELDRQIEEEPETRPGRGMLAGIAGLLLLLAVQLVHQSREALATIPAINSAITPIYRALGRPVAPAWDIGGWRFEATKGSTDDAEQLLTIYSRIGNKAAKAMPYPLIHVALTDRFEEAIGSRIMEPGEYLVAGADPRRMVAPGETFDAVIAIDSPSADATGFQLNVCYRLPSTRLKCAIEDFK